MTSRPSRARYARVFAATTIAVIVTSLGTIPAAAITAPNIPAAGESIDILATSSGIKVGPSSEFVLIDSRALRGQVTLRVANTISPRPFNWIGAFGALFIALAVLLELIHLVRQRRQTSRWLPSRWLPSKHRPSKARHRRDGRVTTRARS